MWRSCHLLACYGCLECLTCDQEGLLLTCILAIVLTWEDVFYYIQTFASELNSRVDLRSKADANPPHFWRDNSNRSVKTRPRPATLTLILSRETTYQIVIISLQGSKTRRHHSLNSNSVNWTSHVTSLALEFFLLEFISSLPPSSGHQVAISCLRKTPWCLANKLSHLLKP